MMPQNSSEKKLNQKIKQMQAWDFAEISPDNQSVNLVSAVLLHLMDF